MPTAHRYALYFFPPDPWRLFGSRWLGRNALSGEPIARAGTDDPRVDEWTAAPRHYGLHATLKAPFRLSPHGTAADLDAATRELAGGFEPFEVTITRKRLRGFIAWCLGQDRASHTSMGTLADTAVARLDAFRAEPALAEIERRRAHLLAGPEQRMLARWGYPYAFETFTFHMTLTGQLTDSDLILADRALRQAGGDALPSRMPVDGVSIFAQAREGEPFVLARHYRFDGTTTDAGGAEFLA